MVSAPFLFQHSSVQLKYGSILLLKDNCMSVLESACSYKWLGLAWFHVAVTKVASLCLITNI